MKIKVIRTEYDENNILIIIHKPAQLIAINGKDAIVVFDGEEKQTKIYRRDIIYENPIIAHDTKLS
jgi:hypothetical protein